MYEILQEYIYFIFLRMTKGITDPKRTDGCVMRHRMWSVCRTSEWISIYSCLEYRWYLGYLGYRGYLGSSYTSGGCGHS